MSSQNNIKFDEEKHNLKIEIERLQVALDRKENFLQNKERKWSACEDILEELLSDNEELRD